MNKKTITARPSLKKHFGKFVNIDVLEERKKIYKKYVVEKLMPHVLGVVYDRMLIPQKDQVEYFRDVNKIFDER
jgi:mitochondrial fission protein ELM1